MKKLKLLIINGPNLNMLGIRDSKHYGSQTLWELNNSLIEDYYTKVEFTFFQSNSEGEIINVIQNEAVQNNNDALIINAAAFSHYSIAIRDALELLQIPKVEVHLSDITKREEFRRHSVISDVCDYKYFGEGIRSYQKAIEKLVNYCE